MVTRGQARCATKNGTFGHKKRGVQKYHFAHHIDFQLVTLKTVP